MNNDDKITLTGLGRRVVILYPSNKPTIGMEIMSYLHSGKTATVEELGTNLRIHKDDLKPALDKLRKSGYVEGKHEGKSDTPRVIAIGKDKPLKASKAVYYPPSTGVDKVIGSGVDKVIGSGADKVIGSGASKVIGANIFLV